MRSGPAMVIGLVVLAVASGVLLIVGARCTDEDAEPAAHYSEAFEDR